MELIIGSKKQTPIKKFVITHTYMIGDGDGYHIFKNEVSEDNPLLKGYLEAINKWNGDYGFQEIQDFYDGLEETEKNDKWIAEIEFDERIEGDLGYYNYIKNVIEYFDENGTCYEVTAKY